jgi:hypothetical protein
VPGLSALFQSTVVTGDVLRGQHYVVVWVTPDGDDGFSQWYFLPRMSR